MAGRIVAALVTVALTLAASLPSAYGAEASVAVARSDGADDCPDASALTASVATLTQTRGKTFQVRFGRAHGRYEARIEVVRGGEGSREMYDASLRCAPLASAVATAIALMLEESTEAPRTMAASATLEPSGLQATDFLAAPRPPSAAEKRDGWGVWIAAGGRIAPGLVPGIGPTLFVEVVARAPQPFSLYVGGFWVFDQPASLPPGQVWIGLAGAWLRGCWRWARVSRVNLAACGAASVGQLRVRGSGFTDDARAERFWLSLGGELEAEGHITESWGLFFRGGVIAPVGRQTAFVDGVGTAWDGPALSATFSAGVQAAIW